MKRKSIPLSTIFSFFLILINFQPCRAQEVINHSSSRDSIYINKTRTYGYKSFIIPAALIATGSFLALDDHIISRFKVKEKRDQYYGSFHSSADNYLQFAPIAIAGILEVTEHNKYSVVKKHVINLVKTELITSVLTYSLKKTTKVKRPDSGAENSFPSGHTAQAFAAAAFLYNEYGKTESKWIMVGGFTIATVTGAMRVLNDRHWISDVIAGAGIGILSANLGCMDWHAKNKNKLTSVLIPQFSKDYKGAVWVLSF